MSHMVKLFFSLIKIGKEFKKKALQIASNCRPREIPSQNLSENGIKRCFFRIGGTHKRPNNCASVVIGDLCLLLLYYTQW